MTNARLHVSGAIAALVLLSLPGLAAAAYQDYDVRVALPPAIVLDGVDKLAIGTLEGAMGAHLATEIRSSLMSDSRGSRVNGTRWNPDADLRVFELLERERLNTVLAEGGETSVAGAVILGHVDMIGPFDNWTEEIRTERRKGNDGEYYDFNVKWHCLERQVKATASLRIVDARTSSILKEVTPDNAIVKSDCNPDPSKVVMTAAEVMARDAVSGIGRWFANQIAPHWGTLNVFLVKDKTVKKITVPLAKGKMSPMEGLIAYKQVLAEDSYNHLAIHNIGTIHEWYGDFDTALDHYERAFRIKAEGAYTKAIERVQGRMDWARQLEGLGLDVTGAVPELSAREQAASEGPPARRMTVKAAKSKRVPMLSSPSESAEVLAQLPGGMQLEVTNEEGDFYEVLAPDGAVGYVDRRYLK